MDLRTDSNWRVRTHPDGLLYSGFNFETRKEAEKEAREQKKWHVRDDPTYEGYRYRRTVAKVLKVPKGYAVFVGALKGQLKIKGKWV